MKIVDRLLNRFGYVPVIKAPKTGRRSFEAARQTRLKGDYNWTVTHIDQDLQQGLRGLRAVGRDLVQNNTYGMSLVHLLQRNVVGCNGLNLQVKSGDWVKGKFVLDTTANSKIETAFEDWSDVDCCTVTRKMSRIDLENLFASLLVSDGEVIFRIVRGYRNRHRFALQMIDPELLDINLNRPRTNGQNEIRMGVEMDQYECPVAYWFLQPVENVSLVYSSTVYGRMEYTRITADEIIHFFPIYRVGQTRGWPLMVPSMIALKMLGAYEEAEAVAARGGACQTGFITEESADVAFEGDGKNDDDSTQIDLQPLSIVRLKKGQEFQAFDPKHPTDAFGPFVKGIKLSVAAGCGLSYVSFTGDVEAVNYSSIRSALQEDREEYKHYQNLFIQHYAKPTFRAWLPCSIGAGQIDLPLSKIEKFAKPRFNGRRWPWVDPKNDAEANKMRLDNKLTTRTKILADEGQDIEDVLQEMQAEDEMAKKYGVKFPEPEQAAKPVAVNGQGGGSDEDETL